MECINCGTRIKGTSKFCDSCGHPVAIFTEEDTKPTKASMLKRILIAIVSIVTILIVTQLVRMVVSSVLQPKTDIKDSKQQSINEAVSREKSSYKLPYFLDEVTRLDDITSSDGSITYKYTLVSVNYNDIDQDMLWENISRQACEKESTRNAMQMGIILNYSYSFEASSDNIYKSVGIYNCS